MSQAAYDALVLMGFGGPESAAEVMPFLERVTAGRGVPPDRLAVVAEHYYALGGASPINAQNRALLAAVRGGLLARGVDVPARLANRNSEPFVADVLASLADDGARRVLAFAPSAFSSYSGCRQYREDLAAGIGDTALEVVKLRPFADLPGFTAAWVDRVVAGVREAGPSATVMFTTHSVPTAMADASGPDGGGYVAQQRAVAEAVIRGAVAELGVRELHWQLAYQSRSGPPTVPWLEPDVSDAVRDLAAAGRTSIVVVPIGFLTDHMEVVWDLDHELAATCREVGMAMTRVPTVGTHPAFVADLATRMAAHLTGEIPPETGPSALCSVSSCCAPPRSTDRDRPVVAGV